MSFKITSPIEGHTDKSVFGSLVLDFKDGVAETDEKLSPGLKAYFKSRGYKVSGKAGSSEADKAAADKEAADKAADKAAADKATDSKGGDTK